MANNDAIVQYTIKSNGHVDIETFNTKGTTCTKMVDHAVQLVGGSIQDEKKKKEYYDKSPKVYSRGVN